MVVLLLNKLRDLYRGLTSHYTGYDEGGFSASTKLDSFVQDFNLLKENWEGRESELADRKANISSFGVLGAAFGSLIAILLNDRVGRLRTYQLAICVWGSGILMQVFSSGIYGFMLFARIWGGLGAGSLTVTAPREWPRHVGFSIYSNYLVQCSLLR